MTPNENIALARSQVREIDRRAIEEYGIPGIVLMENAGRHAAEFILGLVRGAGPVVLVCGGGNNGGDGIVIARHLANRGVRVELMLACDPNRLAGDAAVNFHIVKKMALPCLPFDTAERIESGKPALLGAAAIVDAILGTGFSGNVRPPIDRAIAAINEATQALVVAVDVPSGLDCDTGQAAATTVRAHHTITFVAVKTGFNVPAAKAYTGQVVVADIGVPAALIEEVRSARRQG